MGCRPRTYRFRPELRQPRPATRTYRHAAYEKRRQGFTGHTPSQDAVLAYINTALEEGWSPSLEQIRAHMGWDRKQSAKNCLRNMASRGYLPAGFDASEVWVDGRQQRGSAL